MKGGFAPRQGREEEEYLRIWQYIDTKPQKWELDCCYDPGFHTLPQIGQIK